MKQILIPIFITGFLIIAAIVAYNLTRPKISPVRTEFDACFEKCIERTEDLNEYFERQCVSLCSPK